MKKNVKNNLHLNSLNNKEQEIVKNLLINQDLDFTFNKKTGMFEASIKIQNPNGENKQKENEQIKTNRSDASRTPQKSSRSQISSSKKLTTEQSFSSHRIALNDKSPNNRGGNLNQSKLSTISKSPMQKNKSLYNEKNQLSNSKVYGVKSKRSETISSPPVKLQDISFNRQQIAAQSFQNPEDLSQNQHEQIESNQHVNKNKNLEINKFQPQVVQFSARDFFRERQQQELNDTFGYMQNQYQLESDIFPSYICPYLLFDDQQPYQQNMDQVNSIYNNELKSQKQGISQNIMNIKINDELERIQRNKFSDQNYVQDLSSAKLKLRDPRLWQEQQENFNGNNNQDVMHDIGSRDLMSYFRFIVDNAKKELISHKQGSQSPNDQWDQQGQQQTQQYAQLQQITPRQQIISPKLTITNSQQNSNKVDPNESKMLKVSKELLKSQKKKVFD